MGNANAYIIDGRHKMGKFIKAVFIGVAGSVMLITFFTGLMSLGAIEKLLPWVIGFNAALTGYNMVKDNDGILKNINIYAVCAGTAMVMITTVFLNFIFFYIIGGYLILITDLIFLIPGCSFLSWLGAVLAIKYLNNLK